MIVDVIRQFCIVRIALPSPVFVVWERGRPRPLAQFPSLLEARLCLVGRI